MPEYSCQLLMKFRKRINIYHIAYVLQVKRAVSYEKTVANKEDMMVEQMKT